MRLRARDSDESGRGHLTTRDQHWRAVFVRDALAHRRDSGASEQRGGGDGIVDVGGPVSDGRGGVDLEVGEERVVSLPEGGQVGVEGFGREGGPLCDEAAPERRRVGGALGDDAHRALDRLCRRRRELPQHARRGAIGDRPERGGRAAQRVLRNRSLEHEHVVEAERHHQHHVDPRRPERAHRRADIVPRAEFEGERAQVHVFSALAGALHGELVALAHRRGGHVQLVPPEGAQRVRHGVVARDRAHEPGVPRCGAKQRRGGCVRDGGDVLQAGQGRDREGRVRARRADNHVGRAGWGVQQAHHLAQRWQSDAACVDQLLQGDILVTCKCQRAVEGGHEAAVPLIKMLHSKNTGNCNCFVAGVKEAAAIMI
eukprot:3103157-Pleurochrysis_carterae.AAC.1